MSEQFILFGFKIDLKLHSIQPELDEIKAICDLLPPHSKKSVKSFIGSVNYFCPLIPNLQQILSPIHEAASPNRKPFLWTDVFQTAFEKVNSASQNSFDLFDKPLTSVSCQHGCIGRSINCVCIMATSHRTGSTCSCQVQFTQAFCI